MPELQNILRQRLAGTENGAPVHPDADTITAYVEQSLPTAERQTVVAHLAVCEPCREVLFLSQPEIELAAQAVIKPIQVSAWRRLFTPAFGLAATVAAMAIIAVLLLQLPHQAVQQQASAQRDKQAPSTEAVQPQPTPIAEAHLPQAQASENQLAEAKTSQAVPRPSALLDLAQSTKVKESQSRQTRDESVDLQVAGGRIPSPPPSAKAPVLTAGLLKKDYVNTNFFANSGENVVLAGQSSNDAPSAPQPQNAATSRPFSYGNNKITNFSDIPANATGKSNVRLMTPTPAPERLGCPLCSKVAQVTAHTLHLHAVAPAFRASTLGNSALGGPGMFSNTLEKSQSAEVSAAPKKAEGGSLANSDSFSSRALAESTFSYSTDSPATLWKVAGGKLIKSSGQSQWEDAYPAASIEFSFVSARGKDVWAGGSHASLIHSHDSGATWETVKLGDSASGTVVSIIAGAFNVQIKTSDNQLWSSADGGKTWTLGGE
jgi:Photosynthesis system II assembly factor YCF48/Putative zinc-finger